MGLPYLPNPVLTGLPRLMVGAKGQKKSGSKKIGDDWNTPPKKKGSKNANDGVKNGLTQNGQKKKGFTKNGLKNGRAKKKGEKKKELKKKKRGKVGKMNAFAKKGEGKEPTKTLVPNQGLERRETPPAPEVNRDPMGPATVLLRAKFDVRLAPEKILDPGPGLAKLCAPNLDHLPGLAGLLLEFHDRRIPLGGPAVLLPGAGMAKLGDPNLDQVPACGNCRTEGGPNRGGRAGVNEFLTMGAGLIGLKTLIGNRAPMFGAREEGAR